MLKKLWITGVILFLFLSFLQAQVVERTSTGLLPYPANFSLGEGCFVFTEKTVIALEDKAVNDVVKDFVELFSKSAGFAPRIKVNSKKGDICIRKDASLQEEEYSLEVGTEKIVIKASGTKGVFYALQTLRQLLPSAIEGGAGNNISWTVPVA